MILEILKTCPPTIKLGPSCSQGLASTTGDELAVVEETFKRESSRTSLRLPKELINKELLVM